MIYHGDKQIKQIFHGDKEIIRAYQGDSLVFRSKLIEGEDYEVYKWLKPNTSTASKETAYIDTKLKLLTQKVTIDIELNYSNIWLTNGSPSVMGARNELASNNATTLIWIEKIKGIRCDLVTSNSTTLHVPNKSNTAMRIKADRLTNAIYVNGVKKFTNNNSKNIGYNNQSIRLFSTPLQGDSNYNYIGRIGVVILSEDNIEKGHYIPCKLKRNISAQFASDNKSHNTGECGMYDRVTGKVFFNANTTGAFTVYN